LTGYIPFCILMVNVDETLDGRRMKMKLTKKETAEKRRIDRRVMTGKATRTEIHRGLELLTKINSRGRSLKGETA